MSILGRDIFYRNPPGSVVASLNLEVRLDDSALSAEDRALNDGMRGAVLRDQAREVMFRFLYDEILVEVLALDNATIAHFGSEEKVPPAMASAMMRAKRLLEGAEVTATRSLPAGVSFHRHAENRFVGIDHASPAEDARAELRRDGWLTEEDLQAIRRRSEPASVQMPPPPAAPNPIPPWMEDMRRRERELRRDSRDAALYARISAESPYASILDNPPPIVVPPNTLPVPPTVPGVEPVAETRPRAIMREVTLAADGQQAQPVGQPGRPIEVVPLVGPTRRRRRASA